MKLSKIINTPNLSSVTIDIDNPEANKPIVARMRYLGSNGIQLRTKTYQSLEIDLNVNDADTWNVKHLGVVRYRTYKSGDFYANIYNYK